MKGQRKYFILSLFLGSLFLVTLLWALFIHKTQNHESNSYTLLSQMMEKGVPDFSLPRVNQSSPFSLSRLQGQWILIHFWATWCPPCISELPSLLSTVKELEGKLQLVAISVDSERKDIQDFQKRFFPKELSHTYLLWDKEKKSLQHYGVDKLPVSLLITPRQKLFRRFLGAKDWEEESLKQDLKVLTKAPFVRPQPESH